MRPYRKHNQTISGPQNPDHKEEAIESALHIHVYLLISSSWFWLDLE
jgi:hypothetical protein